MRGLKQHRRGVIRFFHNPTVRISLAMFILQQPISRDELQQLAEKSYGNLVKAVVDVEKEIIVLDAELHADEEELLLENGSEQEDLWGINLYPSVPDEDFIEFDSMINLRPSFGNSSRGVDDPQIRERIKQIVNRMVTK